MISKSRVTGKWVLDVFERFETDRHLPKHAPKSNVQSGNSINFKNDFSGPEDSVGWSTPVSNWGIVENRKDANGGKYNLGWRRRLVMGLEKLLKINKHQPQNPSGNVDPMKILLSVRGSLKEAQDYTTRINLYDETIKQAKAAGQTARVEQLVAARKIIQHESLLISTGFKQYLSEDTVIEFAEKCQKGFRLDWVKNFVRPIPLEVIASKNEADKLMVFDNYVIMHYDPKETAFALTKQQEAAKKDPILFGVIEGVRKLYFIGDWKDDECALTMEEVAKVLGKPSSEINDDPTIDSN